MVDISENVDSGIYFNSVAPDDSLTSNANPALSIRLEPGESHTINVVAGWTGTDTSIPSTTRKEFNLQLNYQQDTTES